MTPSTASAEGPAERLARRATAAGVGFLVLMPVWQVGSRLAGLIWEPPLAPLTAMTVAITVSIAATLGVARRLRRSSAVAASD